ncbi:hypothetical protein D9M73_266100 [compost metagenome]
MQLHRLVAQARFQQLQGAVDHLRQVEAFAQAAGALAGEGLQVAGQRGHALQLFVEALQHAGGLFLAALFEQ